jgi:16S rRNA processing protein RimM
VQNLTKAKEEDKMIQEKNLFEIGKILKPHGVKGEVTVLFNKPEFADSDSNYYFLFLDGMYVPFFVEDFVFNSNVTARIKLQGVDSIEKASIYSNIFVFLPKELVKKPPEVESFDSEWDEFIGYTVFDENTINIGTIREVDSSTINVLFIIEKDGKEVLIPATADFIVKIDDTQKQLYMKLPDGLLDDFIEE